MNFKFAFIFVLVNLAIAEPLLNDHRKSLQIMNHKDQNNHLRSSTGSGNPVSAIFFGGLMIAGAIAMLWYNERRQAITEYRLDQTKKLCTSINSAEVNPNTNNQLVHLNGESKTSDLVVDPIFGLSIVDCIKLERQVEMYQWAERSREENGRRHYYYEQIWSSTQENGGNGHHNDHAKWIIKSETQINQNVFVGAYLMSKSLAEQTNANEKIQLNLTNSQAAANYFHQQYIFKNFDAGGDYIYFQQNPGLTTLNDLRVRFFKSSTGPTTIVSQQQNNTFTPYIIHDKYNETIANSNLDNMELNCCTCCCFCCACCKALQKPLTEIDWIYSTILTLSQVFKKKKSEYQCLTTALRVGGYILMGLGFYYIFSPISWLVSWFPLLGDFLAAVTSFVFFIVSFLISIPFSITVIAFAWIFYHPKFGIALLLLAAGIATALYFYIKSQEG